MALALDLPPLDLPPLDLSAFEHDALAHEGEHGLLGLPPPLAPPASKVGATAQERSLAGEMLLLVALLLGALGAGAVVAAVGIALTV